MSYHERTGWRCQAISQRHRKWGYNCPSVDLDFLVAEYNHSLPVALIEYKDKHASSADLGHPTYRALAALADNYNNPITEAWGLPFFIATYCSEDWWFMVRPINDLARKHYSECEGQYLTEQRFVTSLYLLRKKVLDEGDRLVIAKLNQAMPAESFAA